MNTATLIQLLLTILGFAIPDEERQHGEFGEGTREAVRQFQGLLALPATGEVDGATGTAVIALTCQHILVMQGFEIRDDEQWRATVGDSTREALRRFQAQQRLDRSGELDEATWNALQARAGSGRFSVTGKVADSAGNPFTSGTVQALDVNVDTGARTLLGEVQPAADGSYKIEYTVKQVRELGKLRADLIVIAQADRAITASDVIRNARAVEVVNLTVPAVQSAAPRAQVVSGQVRREDGLPLAGAPVRAFHEDDRGPIRLGADTTDGDGRYTIRYEFLPGIESIHLRVAVMGEDGRARQSSDVVRNAGTLEIIDLSAPAAEQPGMQGRIEGRIVLEHGQPAENLRLRLYRRDFGGEATPLIETTTVTGGRYAFAYDMSGRAASLEVRAVNSANQETTLSKPLNYLDDGRAVALNLVAPAALQPLSAEYRRMADELTPHVGQMTKLADAQENAKQQDLTVLNRATGWDARLIALAATAERLSADPHVSLPQEALYGLMRAGLPSDKLMLAQISPDVAEQALLQAREAGIIALDNQQIGQFNGQFKTFADKVRLAVPAPGSNSTYGEMLQASGLSTDAQDKFASVYLNHRGNGAQLWDKAKEAGLSDADISTLQLHGKLAFLVGNSGPLITRLVAQGIDDPAELVERNMYEADKWKVEIRAAAGDDAEKLAALIPTVYSGIEVEDRLNAFAEDMARKVRLAYPTQVVGQTIARDDADVFGLGAARQSTAALLKTAAAQGFRLGETPVDAFFDAREGINAAPLNGPVNGARQHIKGLQRMYQITPSNESMPVLKALNITSAYDVTGYSEADFTVLYAAKYQELYERPPAKEEIQKIIQKAKQVSSLTYNLFTIAKTMESSPPMPSVSGPTEVRESVKNALIKHFPTMESLFGSMDFCECEHCRSVLSPAAYLVDLLQFIDVEPEVWGNFLARWKENHGQMAYPHQDQNGRYMTAYDVLIERRPDLPHIALTCENTQTALPYIDIVNEILEYYVANKRLSADAARDTDEATTAELLAEPQNVIREAYDEVRMARYPLTLPFDLWLETVRQFCDYFDTPLARLLEVFRRGNELFAPTQPFDRANIFIESLGFAPAEVAILADSDPLADDRWHELYGYPARPVIGNPDNAGQATLTLPDEDAALLGAGLRCAYFDVSANAQHAETRTIAAIGGPGSGGAGRTTVTLDDVWGTPPDAGDRLVPDIPDVLRSAKALARRLGVTYKELVEIIRTGFVNPKLAEMLVLNKLGVSIQDAQFSGDPENQAFYELNKDLLDKERDKLPAADQSRFDALSQDDWQKLKEVQAYARRVQEFLDRSTMQPAQLEAALQGIPLGDILVLADPDAGCSFDLTTLRYADGRAADAIVYLRINLFVRLWRKLGWTIEETDLALQTFTPANARFEADNLGKQPLKSALIYLAHLKVLDERLRVGKQSRLKLATLWSDIATTGKKPLYAQLFLTRSVLKSGEVEIVLDSGETRRVSIFDDPLGQYLTPPALEKLAALVSHRASLPGVKDADKIDAVVFAGEPAVSLHYDPLGEVQHLAYRGILTDPAKAQLAGLSASTALPKLLDAVQTKAKEFSLVKGHLGALQGALGLTAEEINSILADAGRPFDTAGLTVSNVSLLYRYGLLARALKLSVRDLIALKGLSGLNPFTPLHADPPATLAEDYPFSQTLAFVEVAEAVNDSGLKIEDLEYLLRHRFDPNGRYRSDTAGTLTQLKTLAEGVRAIRAEYAVPDDPGAMSREALQQKLGLALPPDVAERFVAMVSGTAEFTAAWAGVEPGDALLPAIFAGEERIRQLLYKEVPHMEQKLTCRGVLFKDQEDKLLASFAAALNAQQKLAFAGLLAGVRQLARDFFDNQLKKQQLRLDGEAGFLEEKDFAALFLPLKPLQKLAVEDTDQQIADKLAENETIERENQQELQKRRARIAKVFLPYLQRRLIHQFLLQTLTSQTGADPALVESLLTDERLLPGSKPLLEAFVAIGERGIDAAFFDADDLGDPTQDSAPVVASTDTALKDKLDRAGNPLGPAGSARFAGYLEVPVAGAYRFYVVLDKQGAAFELRFDHLPEPVFLKDVAPRDGAVFGGGANEFLELKPGLPYRFTLAVTKLGGGEARLLVQGETLPKDGLGQLALYPLSTIHEAERTLVLLTKVLQLLQSLGLSERETRYLLTHAKAFGDLDLSQLPAEAADDTRAQALFGHFLRLAAYARLKRDLASGTDDLIAVFEANATTGTDRLDKLVYPRIAELARRDEATVRATANALWPLPESLPAFASEEPVQRLWEGLQVVECFGVPVGALLGWTGIVGSAATPDQRFQIARDVKEAIKARFEPQTWQRVAQPIFDRLRQRQRDTLVAHVMHRRGFARPEQLFEYFLIDPGMEPVVQTSRIRLAIAAVQVFVQRCLLNLEPRVHPSAIINAGHWEWMKRYRVWEANRKIFLYPENWLEPEFRDDKTHLFAELEGALLQGDVSRDLVEDAFLSYLKKLDELARLDIVAMHLEDKADPAHNTLHVIGRTFAQPHKYFYRRYAHQMWTPWEPVSAEIEGNHLAPVIWRDRLYLFWVTFLEKARPSVFPPSINPSTSISLPSILKDVEAHLHWSEYLHGGWSTRESSDFNAPSPIVLTGVASFDSAGVFIHVSKEPYEDGDERGIFVHLGSAFNQAFYLAGRNSAPEKGDFSARPASPYGATETRATRYAGSGALKVTFNQRIKTGADSRELTAESQTILNQGIGYTLLPCDNNITLGPPDPASLDADNPGAVAAAIQSGLAEITALMKPVFYQDRAHTLFLEPDVAEQTIEQVEQWVTRTPQPEPGVPEWVGDPDRFKKFAKQFVPKPRLEPGDPARHVLAVDPASVINVMGGLDWVTNSATVLLHDGQLIGPDGLSGMQIMPATSAVIAIAQGNAPVNVHAGSGLAADSVVVHVGAVSLEKSGLTQTAGAFNVVTGGGFNSAFEPNLDAIKAVTRHVGG